MSVFFDLFKEWRVLKLWFICQHFVRDVMYGHTFYRYWNWRLKHTFSSLIANFITNLTEKIFLLVAGSFSVEKEKFIHPVRSKDSQRLLNLKLAYNFLGNPYLLDVKNF